MSFDGIEHATGLFQKIKFCFFYGKMFFLLIHFLVVEDYDDALCDVWGDDNALNSSCDKTFDLSQYVVIWS